MAAQSLLAKLGMRMATLGTSASLAIAAPLAEGNPSMGAHTDASRIGMYFDRTPGLEKIGMVVMGTEVMSIGAGAMQMGAPAAVTGALKFYNSTNTNTVTVQSGITSATYVMTLPTAQGGVGTVLTNDGAGVLSWVATGSGTVTSVAMSVPSILSVAGSPVTTSGTLAVTLATQSANEVFAGPTSGGAATPAFRALVTADLPAGTGTITSVAMSVPSILSVAGSPITTSGTLAVTLATQTANTVFAGPTSGGAATPAFRALVTADLPAGTGTVTSVAMSVPAFLSVAGSPITTSGTLAVTLSGTALPVANGGSGATTLTGVLKGNGTSAFTAAVAGTDYVAPGAVTTSGLTMATARILGRTTASTGAIEEITIGSGLSLSAGVLNAGPTTLTGSLTSGRVPFANGAQSLTDSSTMVFSTSAGLSVNTSGVSGNEFFGSGAGSSTASGGDNTAVGASALDNLSSGTSNVGVGFEAGNSVGSTSGNVYLGYRAGRGVSSAGNSVLIGANVGAFALGTDLVYIGRSAGNAGAGSTEVLLGNDTVGSTGGLNIIIGNGAGVPSSTGNSNILVGHSAGAVGTSASQSNTAIIGSQGTVITKVFFGRGQTNAAPDAVTIQTTGGLGTNIAGGNLQLAGGIGTGTGVGGSLIFQTAAAGASSSTPNALTTQLTIDSTGLSTFVGRVVTSASTTTRAGLNLPHGSAPSAPVDGDEWTTSAGLFVRINGVTVGPLTGGGGTIGGSIASTQLAVGSGTNTVAGSASLVWSSTNGLSSNYSAGTMNELFGYQAGKAAMTGTDNVYVGNNAGHATTSGSNNVMIGSAAATVCATGTSSVLIGYNVLGNTITSCTNLVAIGQQASANASTASSDGVFVGYRAGYSSTGAKNIGIGSSACSGAGAGGSGTNNIGIGFSSLGSFTTDSGNIAIGLQALRLQAGATNTGLNVAIGHQSGFFLTTGWGNTLLGTSTGHDGSAGITSGSENICIGHSAGYGIAGTDSNLLFIGGGAVGNVGINNTYIGNGRTNASPTANTFNATGGSGANVAGASMTFAGGKGTGTGVGGSLIFQTAKAGSTGSSLNTLATRLSVLQDGGVDWTGIATASSPAVSAASHGTIFYDSTLQKFQYSANGAAYADLVSAGGITGTLTTGRVPFAASSSSLTDSSGLTYSTANGLSVNKTGNTGAEAIGLNAGVSITTGQSNALFGLSAGTALTTGNRNHFWGTFSGVNQTVSSDNIAVGYAAMSGSGTPANNTGTKNVSLGMNSMYVLTSGSNNICIGYQAGQTVTTGSHNIILGVDADVASATASNQFIAGSATSTINDVYFGKGVSHATPTAYTISGTGGSGTNVAGADLQLAGGPGTGSGAGGSVTLRTSTPSGSGSTANAAVTRLLCDGVGNVVIGTSSLPTNATDGFFYIPSCAGAPSGTPADYTGRSPIIYDSTNNKLWVYNGSWRGIVLV